MNGSERDRGGGHITAGMSEREQVEQTADRLRGEFLLTLQELGRRRGRATDARRLLGVLLSRGRAPLLVAGGAGLVLLAVGVGLARMRARRREARLWSMRWRSLRRAWSHPEQLASSAQERPLSVQLGQRLVLIFASSLASALARRATHGLVPASRSERPRRALLPTQAPARA